MTGTLPRRTLSLVAFATLTVISTLSTLATSARAETPAAVSPAARQEAAARFDRGLKLFNQGENAGALVEFKRAYELTSDPLLLFNIGLVYAEQKRPVDAVDALDRLLGSPARLTAEQRTKAERVRAEQAASIAFIEVATSVPSVIDVDGVEVARTPLVGRLRIPSGTHQIGAVAPGYAPSHRSIDIAGGEFQKVAFELVPGDAALGHVGIRTSLPGADVLLDGKPVPGKTPLPSTLAVAPGEHQIELRRAGYRPASQTVHIDVGSVAEIKLEPELDAPAAERVSGKLQVAPSEADAMVSVDGQPAVATAEPLRLPAGPHHLVVTSAGFQSAELDADVAQGSTQTVRVHLDPTLETRQTNLGRIHQRRVWGWTVGSVGAAATITGIVLVLTGRSALNDANANLTTVSQSIQLGSRTSCDPAMYLSPTQEIACQQMVDDANNRVSNANLRITLGYVTGGVGVAGLVVGAVLLMTGDDPARYEHAGLTRAGVTGWTTGSGGGLLVTGRF
jgi:hypothetical protein